MSSTFLVVDSNVPIRMMLERVITAMGHRVQHTGSLSEAALLTQSADAAIIGVVADDGIPDDFARSMNDIPYARITEADPGVIPESAIGVGVYEKGQFDLETIQGMVSRLLDVSRDMQRPVERARDQSP